MAVYSFSYLNLLLAAVAPKVRLYLQILGLIDCLKNLSNSYFDAGMEK
jgi:hypothetical protein